MLSSQADGVRHAEEGGFPADKTRTERLLKTLEDLKEGLPVATTSDALARFKMMEGANVLAPMGFDAFGLPAENAAIKGGIHPKTSTLNNIRTMKVQLNQWGIGYDWDREVISCLPDYYKWTQWIFIQLYKKGLAYKEEMPINWCPSCKVGLANEEVIDGHCERCGALFVLEEIGAPAAGGARPADAPAALRPGGARPPGGLHGFRRPGGLPERARPAPRARAFVRELSTGGAFSPRAAGP